MLTILAISDTLALYIAAFIPWIETVKGTLIIAISNISCQVQVYLYHVVLSLSGWILVVITVFQIIAVGWPFKEKTLCTRNNANKTFNVTLLCFVYIPVFIGINH